MKRASRKRSICSREDAIDSLRRLLVCLKPYWKAAVAALLMVLEFVKAAGCRLSGGRTHGELLAADGLYAKMYRSQFKGMVERV